MSVLDSDTFHDRALKYWISFEISAVLQQNLLFYYRQQRSLSSDFRQQDIYPQQPKAIGMQPPPAIGNF
jgi:hypothetical protein